METVVEEFLTATGPIDAPRLLSFLGAHAVPGIETWDGTRYARTLHLHHAAGTAGLSAAGGGMRLSLCCDQADVGEAVHRLTHLLGLDDDPRPAEEALAGDPRLGALVRRRTGLRRPGSVDAAETLVRTVVGQQVSLAGASVAAGRLVSVVGEHLDAPVGELTHLFPTPGRIATLDPATLPMPRARARCVVGLARALADDPGLVDDDAALMALPGIGPWTVDYARFRNRRDPDVLLAGDLAVRRQLEATGADGSPDGVRRLGEAWSPHRSTAMMHLWAEYLDRPRGGRRREPRVAVAP